MSRLLPFFIFFVPFTAYLFSVLPSIYWRDAPEFQTIGFLLDISHPAGSPLYAMLVKFFTFLPLGSIAFKTTLLASSFAAGLSLLLYFVIITLIKQVDGNRRGISESSICWVAFFSTLVFSFSNALWENANIPEVYSVQNFFIALFLLFLLKFMEFNLDRNPASETSQKKGMRLFASLFFVYGLSLGVHAILILYLPFFFFLAYRLWLKPLAKSTIKMMAFLLFFFFLGFSNYLYLPLRSAQNPYYDWGDPENFSNLIRHASDRKDAQVHFSIRPNIMPSQLKNYLEFYPDNFSVYGVLLGFLGLAYLLVKREGRILSLLAVFFIPPFLFFIRFWGEASAFLPTFLVFTLLLGVGGWFAAVTLQRCARSHRLGNIILLGVVTISATHFLFLFSVHAIENNSASQYWAPRKVMKSLLYNFPSTSVLFSRHTWFAFNYLQQIEGYRPDLTVFSMTSFLAPTLFTKIEQGRFPHVVIPNVAPENLGPATLNANVKIHPMYWEPNVSHNHLVEKYLVPEGFFFRIEDRPSKVSPEHLRLYVKQISEQLDRGHNIENAQEKAVFSHMAAGQGDFFLKRGLYEVALDHFKLSVELVPQSEPFNLLGVGYAYLENYRLSEVAFLESISKDPYNHEPHLNLAEVFFSRKMFEASIPHFEGVLSIVPDHGKALYRLGEVYIALGKKKLALHYFQRILEVNKDHEKAKQQVTALLNE